MIVIEIPGRPDVHLSHLVADFNGTLAEGGSLVPGVAGRIEALARQIDVVVITADTFGRARHELGRLPVELVILAGHHQDQQKADYVKRLGQSTTVAIGNGFNDRLMLAEAELGLAVVLAEGAAVPTVEAADLLFAGICDALDALLDPRRLVASLRR